jgi:hypothetical protein
MNIAQHKTWSCYSCKPVGPCAEPCGDLTGARTCGLPLAACVAGTGTNSNGPGANPLSPRLRQISTQRRWGKWGKLQLARVASACYAAVVVKGPLSATIVHRRTEVGELGHLRPATMAPTNAMDRMRITVGRQRLAPMPGTRARRPRVGAGLRRACVKVAG